MKTTLLFILTVFVGGHAFSQDVLNIKDGSLINAKVIEITDDQVRYKDQANPDGPVYVMSKNKISSIHYKNGSDEVFSSNSSSGNPSLTNVVNGYNTDPSPSASNYSNINDNTVSQPANNAYPNTRNAGRRAFSNTAALSAFAILALNVLGRVH